MHAAPIIALVISFAILQAHAADPASADLSKLPDEELISKLQEISNDGVGFDSMAWAGGFLALDEDPEFRGGIMGSPKPHASPVVRELVRRGCKALPALIEHLQDTHPTKLTVGKGFMARWFSVEYDPRDPEKMPDGVLTINDAMRAQRHQRYFETYNVKVGDICFVTIGQIVNRNLNAVRYQPSLCLVVNSQTENPTLSAATKADWFGLTPAAHEQSLLNDVEHGPLGLARRDAVKRLLFYYPKSGEQLALKLLDRPLCDPALASKIVEKRLLPATSDKQTEHVLADFRSEYGEMACLSVRDTLAEMSTREVYPKGDKKRTAEKNRAAALLAHLFPGTDAHNPSPTAYAYCSTQADFIRSIASFEFTRMDESLLNIIPRVIPLESTAPYETYAQYELVQACARLLAKHAASKPELKAPLLKNLSAFRKSRTEAPD
ncbi:MAG: hypothetical protein ACREKL_00360, partial [Chthoniobacterales bacterium]